VGLSSANFTRLRNLTRATTLWRGWERCHPNNLDGTGALALSLHPAVHRTDAMPESPATPPVTSARRTGMKLGALPFLGLDLGCVVDHSRWTSHTVITESVHHHGRRFVQVSRIQENWVFQQLAQPVQIQACKLLPSRQSKRKSLVMISCADRTRLLRSPA